MLTKCWRQNSVRVVESSRVEVDADAGLLRFKPLNKSDEQRYNCTATNDVGSDSDIVRLRVLGRWKLDISVFLVLSFR